MQQLQRELGVFGATMMGLGCIIVGTGIFVSIRIAAGVAMRRVVFLAVLIRDRTVHVLHHFWYLWTIVPFPALCYHNE